MEEQIPHRSGKDFEEDLLKRGRYLEKQKVLCLGRYGVQAVMVGGEWKPIDSYPDLEGAVAPNGRQIVIEAKAWGQPSFDFSNEKHIKAHQIKHLMKRARFGALCFVVLHFNARKLTKQTLPARTFAVPVHPDLPFWESWARGEVKSTNWNTLENYDTPELAWSTLGDRGTRLYPEIESLLDYQYEID